MQGMPTEVQRQVEAVPPTAAAAACGQRQHLQLIANDAFPAASASGPHAYTC